MRRLDRPSEQTVRGELLAALHRSEESRCLHRLHAILLVALGHSCYEAAAWLGDDARTVERWVHAYQEQGLSGLRAAHCGGRHPALGAAQVERLRADIAAGPAAAGFVQRRWTGKLLARHLARQYRVQLGERQCIRLISTLVHRR